VKNTFFNLLTRNHKFQIRLLAQVFDLLHTPNAMLAKGIHNWGDIFTNSLVFTANYLL